MFKVKNKDTRLTPVFIVNFENILQFALVFLLSTLNMQLPAEYCKSLFWYLFKFQNCLQKLLLTWGWGLFLEKKENAFVYNFLKLLT